MSQRKLAFGVALLATTCLAYPECVHAQPGIPRHERIEWTNIWVTNANRDDKPRVLMIGDSIVRGYFSAVERQLDGAAYCAHYTTSAFAGHEDFLSGLAILLKRYRFSVIHVNNGLHGWDYSEDEYRMALERLGDLLEKEGRGAAIVWATTTPVRTRADLKKLDELRTARVRKRNEIALAMARRRKWAVSDLFALSIDHPEHYRGDGVHFSRSGVEAQGKCVAEVIRRQLSND